MTVDWIHPHFTAVTTVLAIVLIADLALVAPIVGRRLYNRLVAAQPKDPRALTRHYRRFVIGWWAVTAVLLVALASRAGIRPQDVGLALPRAHRLALAIGLAAYLMLVVVIGGIRLRQRLLRGESSPRGAVRVTALAPGTRQERRMAVVVSITAGTCEELAYRGFLIAVGVGVLGLSPHLAALLALAVFAVGHLYQGVYGLISSTVVGFVLTLLYLLTASLLLPIVVHAVVDLNALLLVHAPSRRQPVSPAPAAEVTIPTRTTQVRSAVPLSD
jgi:uncharacterized protein